MYGTYLYRDHGSTFESLVDLNTYLTGGKAVVEIDCDYGNFKYSVRTPHNTDEFDPNILFVFFIDELDKNHEVYVGMIKNDAFKLTTKSPFSEDEDIVVAFKQLYDSAKHLDKFEENQNSIRHLGRCCYCGKKLLLPQDIEKGYHSDCYQLNYIPGKAYLGEDGFLHLRDSENNSADSSAEKERPTVKVTPRKQIKSPKRSQAISQSEEFDKHYDEIASDPNYWKMFY